MKILETVKKLANLSTRKAESKRSAPSWVQVFFLFSFVFTPCIMLHAASDLELPFIALDASLPQRVLSGEESFAVLYLDTAAQILKTQAGDQSKYQRALEVILRGLDLAPQIGDLNYACAWLSERLSKHDQALEYYKKALEPQAQWLKAHWSDAAVNWAQQVMRRGDLGILTEWMEGPLVKHQLVNFSALLAQAIKTYFFLDKKVEANRLLNIGLSRYPDDLSIMALKLRFAPPSHLAASAWFNRFTNIKDPKNKEALFWLIQSMQPSQERLLLTSQFLKNYGPDDWIVLAALESIGEDLELRREYLSFFMAPGVSVNLDVLERVLSILPVGLERDQLQAGLTRGKRMFFRDREFDGYFEEELYFENGLPVFWTRDSNQNATVDSRVSFVDGRPVSIGGEVQGKSYLLRYHNYPELASLSLATNDGQEDCFFLYGGAEMRVVELVSGVVPSLEDLPSMFTRSAKVELPIYELLKQHSYLSNNFVFFENKQRFRLIQTRYQALEQAIVQREDSNGDGIFDSMTWFDSGTKALVVSDPRDDGSFPVLEQYKNGALERRVFFSARDNLAYEYKPNSALLEFDVNRNKIIETAELQNANRLMLRQFSSLLPRKMLSFEQ